MGNFDGNPEAREFNPRSLYDLALKVMPYGTLRRKTARTVTRAVRAIFSFCVRPLQKIRFKNFAVDAVLPVDTRISVVIPTFNAGTDFTALLESLTTQELIAGTEIIVVDSGSLDDTVNVAKDYGAKVIRIQHEDFSHSYSRNLGAENATESYILFITQDALPNSSKFLRCMLEPMRQDKKIVAVSCGEIPKPDADLFGLSCSWGHAQFMALNEGDRILKMPVIKDLNSIRKNANLNDVACLIDRSVFERFKYRFNYAEDLDMGVRLISAGYSLAMLTSAKVVHSHTRPPFYYLKRSFVERKAFHTIFNDSPVPHVAGPDFLYASCSLYRDIYALINEIRELDTNCSLEHYLENTARLCNIIDCTVRMPSQPPSELRDFDENLYDFMLTVYLKLKSVEGYTPSFNAKAPLVDFFKGQSRVVIDYLRLKREYTNPEPQMVQSIIKSFLCVFASATGNILGHSCLCDNDKDPLLSDLYEKAGRGV